MRRARHAAGGVWSLRPEQGGWEDAARAEDPQAQTAFPRLSLPLASHVSPLPTPFPAPLYIHSSPHFHVCCGGPSLFPSIARPKVRLTSPTKRCNQAVHG